MALNTGYIFAFMAAIFYGVLPMIAKKASTMGITPFSFISATMFALFVLSSIAAFSIEKKIPLFDFSGKQLQLLALFSVLNFCAFSLLNLAVREVPVPHYQLITIVSIFVGVVVSAIFLSETIKPSFYVGSALVTAGLYIALFK